MGFIQIIFIIFSGILGFYFQLTTIVLVVSFFKKKFGNDTYLKPLDEIDGAKLTSMVDEQINLYLLPLLKSKGYSEEKIKEILTSKSIGIRPFLRR
ncbi:hypothetical protein [Nostoc sp.]|uniref:hypothetical protein n=1 Tax=Nostoc sp. TaxID=1180 RepID=UPI002FFBF3CB